MKRKMGYTIHQNKSKSLEEMRKVMTTILEHHFNNHTCCGDWCLPFSGNRVRRFVSHQSTGAKNEKLYKQLKMHHNKFVTKEWMQDLMQNFGLKKEFLTKCPKHNFFA
jgi:ABC-type dipeptide/oligopeptide/nickel transport system ATPase subunit